MVNMMSNDNNCFVYRKKGHIGHHYPQALCHNCDDFGYFTCDFSEKVAPSETPCHQNWSCSQLHSNHSCRDMSHFFDHRCSHGNHLRGQDLIINPSVRSCSHQQRHTSCSISHHDSHSYYPSTDTLEDIPTRIPHTNTGTTHLVTHHTRVSHHTYSTDCSQSISRNSSGTTYGLHTRKISKPHSWREIPPYTQAQKEGHYSGLTKGFLLRIEWRLRYFKLLKPSSCSDEDSDERGGLTQLQQYTIGLIFDCLPVTVHAGKCYKALVDSSAAISSMQTSIYKMIENHYKTCILPAAVNLWTADGSPMSTMGKATLHLLIAEYKFLHTFVICDRIPKTDFLLV